jgi:hypothetical protein
MNDELHTLIKAMTKSEKRYFKLFARRVPAKEERRHEQLFDAIDALNEYDEEKIKRRFEKESFAKHLPTAKQELYNAILRSLHSFHEENAPQAKLRSQLHFAEILLGKGLIKHARQQLRVARDIAQKHELLTYVPSILRLERQVEDKQSRNDPHQHLQHIYEQYCDSLKKLSVQALYIRRQKQVQHMASKSAYSRSKSSDYADIDHFLALPEIAEERGPSSVHSQFYYNDIQVYAAFLHADYEKVYLHSSRMVRLAQEHKTILQHDTAAWLAILHRHATACALLKLAPELNETATLIRGVKTTDERFRVLIVQYSSMAEFNACALHKDFEKMRTILPRFESEFAETGDRMERLFYYTLSTQASAFYFLLENFQKSLVWINRALNTPEITTREDIYLSARITEIQTLFELQKTEQLGHRLKSFFRYLSKKPHLFQIEQLFIRQIRKLADTPPVNMVEFFQEIKNGLLEAQRSAPEEKRMYYYIDLIAWFDSKIENRPLREIIEREEEPKRAKKK